MFFNGFAKKGLASPSDDLVDTAGSGYDASHEEHLSNRWTASHFLELVGSAPCGLVPQEPEVEE